MPILITEKLLLEKITAEEKVCRVFHIDRDIIESKRRTDESAKARFAVWIILKYGHKWSYKAIAQVYGMHHSSVMHGIRQGIAEKLDSGLDVNIM